MSEPLHETRLVVNGVPHTVRVPARRLLADCLRHDLGLTGTHVGCEHGVCGACTVLVDGRPMRSCLLFAVGVDGAEITTVEGLGTPEAPHPLQSALVAEQALQCGSCISGILISAAAFALALGSTSPAFAQDTDEQPTSDASPSGTVTGDEPADEDLRHGRASVVGTYVDITEPKRAEAALRPW